MAHILAIRFSALGDVAMTVPVLYAVAKQYPQDEFTILTTENMGCLFEHLPRNVHFRGVDLNRYKGMVGLNTLFYELYKEGYDAVADLHDVIRTMFIRMAFRLKDKPVANIDKSRMAKRRLVQKDKKDKRQLKTSVQRYADVFAELGYPVDIAFDSIYGDRRPDLPDEVVKLTGSHEGTAWVGVAPFARHKGKIYPLELMAQVLELLDREGNVKVFLFGFGRTEETWCRAQEQERKNVTSLVGKLGLQKELMLMSHLDVMLSMDSANMHMAFLTHTPVVSVWGATHPYAGFAGLQTEGSEIIQADMACRPCSIYGNKPCYKENYECMYSIKPATVAEAVMRTCNNKNAAHHE